MTNDRIDAIIDRYPRDASWINERSTLPVHMRRTILTLGLYCSLETPARSAAP